MSESTYTEEELSAFSDKLQAWGDGLPEREQQLLGNLVGRAAAHTQGVAEAEEAEVVGFAPIFMEFEGVVARSSRIALSPLSPTTVVRYKDQ